MDSECTFLEDRERQLDEIEALQSMYPDDFSLHNAEESLEKLKSIVENGKEEDAAAFTDVLGFSLFLEIDEKAKLGPNSLLAFDVPLNACCTSSHHNY